ncbi:MAG: hypothetical protein ACI9OJ_004303, partial [Myxococcota bacterium]
YYEENAQVFVECAQMMASRSDRRWKTPIVPMCNGAR